jgi:hypothetical protein
MIRDKSSKALINNDIESLNKYKIERKMIRQTDNLSKEISKLKEIIEGVCERIENLEKRV